MFLKSTLHALIELKSMLEKGTLVEELSESGQKKAKKYLPFRKRRPGKRIDEVKICVWYQMDKLKLVDIKGIQCIESSGAPDMVKFMWASESFNPATSATFFGEV